MYRQAADPNFDRNSGHINLLIPTQPPSTEQVKEIAWWLKPILKLAHRRYHLLPGPYNTRSSFTPDTLPYTSLYFHSSTYFTAAKILALQTVDIFGLDPFQFEVCIFPKGTSPTQREIDGASWIESIKRILEGVREVMMVESDLFRSSEGFDTSRYPELRRIGYLEFWGRKVLPAVAKNKYPFLNLSLVDSSVSVVDDTGAAMAAIRNVGTTSRALVCQPAAQASTVNPVALSHCSALHSTGNSAPSAIPTTIKHSAAIPSAIGSMPPNRFDFNPAAYTFSPASSFHGARETSRKRKLEVMQAESGVALAEAGKAVEYGSGRVDGEPKAKKARHYDTKKGEEKEESVFRLDTVPTAGSSLAAISPSASTGKTGLSRTHGTDEPVIVAAHREILGVEMEWKW